MQDEAKQIKIVPAICTQCSAQIEVDSSRDAAICPHCGTAFIVEKAVKSYIVQNIQHTNVEHIDTVNINTTNSKASSKQNFLDRHFDRLTMIAIEKERLKVEKERLKAEKEKRRAEEMARQMKYLPLQLVVALMIVLSVIAFLFFKK